MSHTYDKPNVAEFQSVGPVTRSSVEVEFLLFTSTRGSKVSGLPGIFGYCNIIGAFCSEAFEDSALSFF